MMSLTGLTTASTRGAVLFNSSLTQNSSRETSITFSLFEIPAVLTKFFKACGGYPRLRIPEIVGILGSSQSLTY